MERGKDFLPLFLQKKKNSLPQQRFLRLEGEEMQTPKDGFSLAPNRLRPSKAQTTHQPKKIWS
jgi:hypothetical protein